MFQQDIDRRNGYRPGVGILIVHQGTVLLGCKQNWLSSFLWEGDDIRVVHHPEWSYSWDILQGGVEEGETFNQAIRREACEELCLEWANSLSCTRFLRREQLEFPVFKDGRRWRGKTYYFHAVAMQEIPDLDSYYDWVWGPNSDEPCSHPYPIGEFQGGVLFLNYQEACRVIRGSQRGNKGALVLRLLDELRNRKIIS
jgi:8-oxo-dGTP pyrophosphatase MutT (NUDIX family)